MVRKFFRVLTGNVRVLHKFLTVDDKVLRMDDYVFFVVHFVCSVHADVSSMVHEGILQHANFLGVHKKNLGVHDQGFR